MLILGFVEVFSHSSVCYESPYFKNQMLIIIVFLLLFCFIKALLASDYSQGNYRRAREVVYKVLQVDSSPSVIALI